ncbi:flagellar biosynthesis protein FlhF [Paenibacillus sp. H1-7]|uniref:flagellar biosynthesis protein FlhF n=1 Tax=Paenibacillus sp. H1-7 TaxID=2282849 RepID=UPI001EF8ABEC|nr:flagellar biosynthesis protein FlhF [Paenibacillus sp. H1-7]ULL17321.1 flagellar biosynthesis protein FlhF [Paenibacillus sp. H1-7]
MRVKRYVVDSMPDALQKIRTDLGKDAVILNTKEIRSGGFLGMFSKKKIEVIAATDAAETAGAGGKAGVADMRATVAVKPAVTSNLSEAAGTYTRPVPVPSPNKAPVQPAEPLAFPVVPDVLVPDSPRQADSAAYADKQVKAAASQQAAARTEAAKDDLLLNEMKQMKEYMHKLSVQVVGQAPVDPVLEQLQQRLLEHEIDPELVSRLIERAVEELQADGEPVREKDARQSLKRQLLELFPVLSGNALEGDTKIAHFVGPTGVGKTTTIAKLAAEQVLKYQRKVGFITSDTYRIAAVEQLKTYATILNVPLEVVFSPQDLPKAFESLKDRDIIFMDTAGRNFRNEMYVSELNALLQSGGKSETYLVMSLTTKYKDMKAIAENFSKFKLDKVLFTKMDETDSYGAVINLVHDFQLSLSYITNGQSVPDDITELKAQQIVDLILGVQSHE